MNEPGFWDSPDKANELIAKMKAVKAKVEPVADFERGLSDARELWDMAVEAEDQETKEEVDAEVTRLEKQAKDLSLMVLLSGKYDDRNCYLSIDSGAGGTEADDWCEMLFRMYLYYCERMGWDVSEVSKTHGTEAGLKEVTLYIKGPMAYGYLSAEQGTHRLARVSPFNAEGKRQTSFAAVEVVPEFPETGGVEIDEDKLEVTQFARSSGPGGQNVNKVASAIRLTYKYDKDHTLVVLCSVERRAEQNKKKAMALLRGKIELLEEQKRQREMDAATGGGAERGWGSQVRSYVFYDNRVKDHRTGHEQPNPQHVLDGDLHQFVVAELQRRAKAGAEASAKAGV